MRNRVPAGFDRLGRKGPSALEDRERGHHRQPHAGPFEVVVDGEQAGLQHQRVEGRFAQQNVDAPLDQRVDLLAVGGHHLVEGGAAVARVVHVAGDRELLVRRPDRAGDEAGLFRRAQVHRVDGPPGQRHGGQVQLADPVREAEIGHADARGPEGVRLDDVGARFQVLAVDVFDGRRLRDRENIDEILQIVRVIGEGLAAVVSVGELQRMDHRAHGPVEDQDALSEQLFEQGPRLRLRDHCHPKRPGVERSASDSLIRILRTTIARKPLRRNASGASAVRAPRGARGGCRWPACYESSSRQPWFAECFVQFPQAMHLG